jgi:hypothetical protein
LTVADPEEFGLVVETAVTVTGTGLTLPIPFEAVGTPPGATKLPVVEIYPVAWDPPVTLLTCQVTAELATPFTVAVNCCVAKTDTLAGFGVTITGTCCATVTIAVP